MRRIEWAASAERAYLEYLAYLTEVAPNVAPRAELDVDTITGRLAQQPKLGQGHSRMVR